MKRCTFDEINSAEHKAQHTYLMDTNLFTIVFVLVIAATLIFNICQIEQIKGDINYIKAVLRDNNLYLQLYPVFL